MGLASAVGDGEVLDRDRMPVFKSTVTDPAAGEVPAPADRFNGFDRTDISLGQAVKRVTTGPGRRNQRQLLDTEIFGLAFKLHLTCKSSTYHAFIF